MSIVQALRFPPGKFLGDASVCIASHGVSISHCFADRDPDDVPTHTHEDAHFFLVTWHRWQQDVRFPGDQLVVVVTTTNYKVAGAGALTDLLLVEKILPSLIEPRSVR